MIKDIILVNNTIMPMLGFGTWCIPNSKAKEAVKKAIELGYRHIDTAQAYGNEAGTGAAIVKSHVSRESLFVVSKVAAEHKSYDAAARSIDETLHKMGLDYLDLMLIHSPQPWNEWRGKKRYFKENREVWKALEKAYQAGKVRAIGVSNFQRDDLENLLSNCKIKPMVNQVLAHIGNTPFDLIEFCQAKGIAVEAYSPIAHGAILENEVIGEMAKAYQVTIPQLCIRYLLQLGLAALPKAAVPIHMQENLHVDFEILAEDMERLRKLDFKDYGEYGHFPVFSGK